MTDKAEIMNIDSLNPADSKNVLGAYYGRGAVCIFHFCTLSNQNNEYFTNSTKWLPAIFR